MKQDDHKSAQMTAWSCTQCGHIRGDLESGETCSHCGVSPAAWNGAPLIPGPVDLAEPAVGHNVNDGVPQVQGGSDPLELFPTSPPGTEGYDVNAELRVRY